MAFLAIQVALLAVARVKAAFRQGRPWTQGRLRAVCRFADSVTSREIGLVWLLAIAMVGLASLRGHERKLAAELAASQERLARQDSPWVKSIYGSPPMPGRCER